MNHYLNITLLPDPEFPIPTLMNALFAKLHRVLAQLNSSDIGVSFPAIAQHHLGNVLRLHGSKSALEKLMQQTWLTGMRDHTEVCELQAVPANVSYCRVSRAQAKSSADRLRRRYQKRHPEQAPEVVQRLIPDGIEQRLELPFIRMKSLSTGQYFLLFIRQQPAAQKQTGQFNTYGLSQTATLPIF